ncbi:hypothetical protein FHR95_000482 [Halomonas fontilapidosi]|uniref:GIY-YIG domain-containing protein n=1 Tax=Halomonas fontilapidosi TaxID=616675 RepID=A0A7W5GX46_9GAMM|nr:GIY-YIG nuclease family protein [Halomonas fontilapidosi]MBB3182958.1 hypothetical protein [Halomonas fontilapidosi]
MSDQILSLKLLGYWTDEQLGDIPDISGIFCVYAGTPAGEGEPEVERLLYIGESGDVRQRIRHHELREKWSGQLESGQVLCYSVAAATYVYRERLEAAMVNLHKPPVNHDYIDRFPFDTTEMHLRGRTDKLVSQFIVERAD